LGSRYNNKYEMLAPCSARPLMEWGDSSARFSIRIGLKMSWRHQRGNQNP